MSRLAFRFLSLFNRGRSPASESTPEAAEARPSVTVSPAPHATPLPVWTHCFPPGKLLVREGEPGQSMFVIVEGRVAVMRQPPDGPQKTVGYLSTGDFFGELALVTECRRTASIMAVERTVVLELTRAGLAEAGARHGLEATVVRTACQERLMADALRTSPLLATLPPELAVQLVTAFVPRAVEPGEPILTRGLPGDALYLLLRGRCSVFHAPTRGDVISYPDLQEGAVFGEVSMLRSRVATASVEALTPCTLLRLERDVFRKFFIDQPALRRELVQMGMERLQRTLDLMSVEPPISSY